VAVDAKTGACAGQTATIVGTGGPDKLGESPLDPALAASWIAPQCRLLAGGKVGT
jgi:hypothetical protein